MDRHHPVTVDAEPYPFEFVLTHCALLIIDMQRDFLEAGGFGEMLGNDVAQLRRTIEPNPERRLFPKVLAENAAAKGRRYLTEGRLQVWAVTGRRIAAVCRGDGAIYHPGYDAGRWYCDCPAKTDRCAHLVALRLVTTAPSA